MRKKELNQKENNLSYIKVDIHNEVHLSEEHIKDIKLMLKHDYHDALLRYDIDKMVYMNHTLKETEEILHDLIHNPNEDSMTKKYIRSYLNLIRIIRETFSTILNTQEIISHFMTRLTPIQIRILVVLNENPEMTMDEITRSIGKSQPTVKKEIDKFDTDISLPIVKRYLYKDGRDASKRSSYHYELTSYGKHLINYIEDMSYDMRIRSLNETRHDVQAVFKEQRYELWKIKTGKE